PGTTAHLVVPGDPGVRQRRALLVQHSQGQLMPSAEANLFGYARLAAAFAVAGPLLGQVEANIDQGVLGPRDVAEVDADRAVVDLAQSATPLPGHADRLGSLLGEG